MLIGYADGSKTKATVTISVELSSVFCDQVFRCLQTRKNELNYVWDQSFIVSKLYLLQYSRLLHVWSDGSFTNETRAQSASSLHVNNLWWWEVCADIFRSDSSIDFPFQMNKSICFSFFSFSFFWKCISKISKSSVPVSEPRRAGSHWSLCEWQTAFTTFPTTTFIWISKKKKQKKNQRNYINMHAVNIPPSTFRINVYFYYADNDTVFSTEGQMIMKTNI